MKVKFNKIALIILFVGLVGNILAQDIWGPEQTTYRRDLRRIGTQDVVSNGLQPINTLLYIGNENNVNRRLVYHWEIPDTEIPDSSTINNVTLYFTYSKNGHSYELPVYFYSLSYDIVNPNQTQLNGMWDEMGSTNIGYLTGTDNVMNFVSNNSNNAFNQAVRNALPNNKFILGIKYQNENPNYNRTWLVDSYSMTLRIEYTPPQKLVVLDQRLSNNTQIGKLRKWEGTEFTPLPYIDPGAAFNFQVNSSQTIQGDQAVYSNEKYQKWIRNTSDDENVSNHHSFAITSFDNTLTSKFNPIQSGITIKNGIEGTTVSGGYIKFADPWYIDYADPAYGESPRNRGMKNTGTDALQYRQRTSPFYPDNNYVFQNGNDPAHAYQGVFLHQDPTFDPNVPNYSVQAINSQDIPVGGAIGTRKFYFQSWSAEPVNSASFQNVTALTTAVVFNNSGATVKANLKGQGLSNNSEGFSTPSQRKIVRTEDGMLHRVYESMGHVWYEISSNNGQSWSLRGE